MKNKTDAELIEEAESVALVRFVWSDDERRARVLAHELASRLKAANEALRAACVVIENSSEPEHAKIPDHPLAAFAATMKPLEKEYADIINNHFWELLL